MLKSDRPAKIWALVPAAGIGKRFGGHQPKQYHPLAGKTIIEHSLAALLAHARIERVIVAINAADEHWQHLPIASHAKVETTIGGAERVDSVVNALGCIRDRVQPGDWVLVHDAARPCLTTKDLDNLINLVFDCGVGGILASPAVDTIKWSVSEESTVAETLDRRRVWHALTPQMFRYDVLIDALSVASSKGREITDEASAIEFCGGRVALIEGSRKNLKVTQVDDLLLAEAILAQQDTDSV